MPGEIRPAALAGMQLAVAIREARVEHELDRPARDVLEPLFGRRQADLVIRVNRVEVADEQIGVAGDRDDRLGLCNAMRLVSLRAARGKVRREELHAVDVNLEQRLLEHGKAMVPRARHR